MYRSPRTVLSRLRALGFLAATASLLGAAEAQTIQQDFDGLAAGSTPAGWKATETSGFPSFFSAVEVSAAQAVRYDLDGTLKTSAIPAGSPLLAPSNWIDVDLRAGSLFLDDCLWAVSTASVPTPAFGGTLAAAPLAVAVPLPTDLTGSTTLSWTAWPAGFASGSHLYFQVLCPDPSAPPQGVALSNALEAELP